MTARGKRLVSGIIAVLMTTTALGFLLEGTLESENKANEIKAEEGAFSGEFSLAFGHGLAAYNERRLNDAKSAFQEAVRINPKVPEAHVNLGYVYLDLGQIVASRTAFEQAVELQPYLPNAYFGLGEVLERQGDLAGALGAMRTYVHLTTEQDEFHTKAAAAVWELESRLKDGPASGGAVSALATAVESFPGFSDLLSRNRGRVVLLNVWATWCGPCRQELPSLQALSSEISQTEAVVIGLSVDESPEFVMEFINELEIYYKNYIDPKGDAVELAFEFDSYPQTVIFDRNGNVSEVVSGAKDWASVEMLERIADVYENGGKPNDG